MIDDFGNELEEIRREIVESRALSIKTNNLVNALSADLNSIAKRQQGYERRMVVHSSVTYAVSIAGLLLLGKVFVDARVDAVRAETQNRNEELTLLTKEAQQAKSSVERHHKSQKRAQELYELVRRDKYLDLLKAAEEIDGLELSRMEREVFASALEQARNELSRSEYLEGLDYIRTGRWHEAEQSLSLALKYKPTGSHTANGRLQLARALKALGKQREAIPILLNLSEASPDKELMDEAAMLLAECQIDMEAFNDAIGTLRTFVRRFPNSPLIHDARMKLANIQSRH
jgi:TolA-binding protein